MLSQKPHFDQTDFFLFNKTCEQQAAPHFHKYAEVLFSGNTSLNVYISKREVLQLNPQQMLVIPPEQVHAIENSHSNRPYSLLHINLDKLFLLFSPCPYSDHISSFFSENISSFIFQGEIVRNVSTIYQTIKNKFEIKYVGDLINIINLINENTPQDIINLNNDAKKMKFYSMLNELVESEAMDNLHLEYLCKKFFMSKSTFQRQVKKCTGLTFHAWLQRCKMQKALVDLRKNVPVSEIALNLGFSSASHFCKTFKSYYGITPNASRNGSYPQIAL